MGNIVVKPHIYKFICWVEHIPLDENGRQVRPLLVGNSGVVGHTLKMILTYKSNTEFYHKGELSKKYSMPLNYLLRERDWDRGKLHISKADIIEFNSHMHKLFHEFLLRKIIEYARMGRMEKEAIEDYLILMGAEEDVHWDSVKRVNLRLRNAKKMTRIHDKKTNNHKPLINN